MIVDYVKVSSLKQTTKRHAMTTTSNKAALLDSSNKVIGEVFHAPLSDWIKVAGCLTVNGDPVNIKSYKISRSKKNLHAAMYEQPLTETKVKGVFTFNFISY